LRAGIVIIGNEILSGKFADENAAFLIGELRALGVELGRISVIPDDEADIAETVTRHAARFDMVFTSGGVGPTHDDVTIAGIARGFGVGVVRHPVLMDLLRAYYGDRLTESHLRLAEVPEGTEMVYGTDPVWPVVMFRNVYILPGVPSLVRRKFLQVRERFASRPFRTGRVYLMADEAANADELTRVVATHQGVSFGSYPRVDEPDFRVLLTVESQDEAAARAACAALVAALQAHVVRFEDPS
jgi:molybdenum cofactor synthesis domain-containing protein